MNTQDVIGAIHSHKGYLKRTYGFHHIFLFGSFATGTMTAESDVDLLVDVDKASKTYHNYLLAKAYLKKVCQREIDLVYRESINPVIEQAIQSRMIEIE